MALSKYTPEENRWIIENIDVGTYPQLVKAFAERFGRTVSESGLRKQAKRLKLNGEKLNSSHIKKGESIAKTVPIGAEYTDSTGTVYVKIADKRGMYNKRVTGGKTNGGNWIKKGYQVWEQAYGSIPEGKRLIYLDGNKQNFAIANLYFADVRIQLRLCRNHWYSSNPDLTLAAIKYLELFYALKDMGVKMKRGS